MDDVLKEGETIMDNIRNSSVASLNAALQKHRLETKEAASRGSKALEFEQAKLVQLAREKNALQDKLDTRPQGQNKSGR